MLVCKESFDTDFLTQEEYMKLDIEQKNDFCTGLLYLWEPDDSRGAN